MARMNWSTVDAKAARAGLKRGFGDSGYDRLFNREKLPVWKSVLLETTERGDLLGWPFTVPDYWVEDTTGLLAAFSRLADASPEKVRLFARRWGPLWLCEHDYPFVFPHIRSGLLCIPASHESVNVWKRYALSARTLISIAADLHGSGSISHETIWVDKKKGIIKKTVWLDAHPLNLPLPRSGPSREELTSRAKLAKIAEFWLTLGDVRPTISWPADSKRMQIDLGAVGLFSSIARELSFTLARADGLLFCQGCGRPYAPKTLKQKHCDPCRKAKIPERNQARRRRTRERAGASAE